MASGQQASPYVGNGHANGNGHAPKPASPHPANAHMAIPIAMRDADSQPILPPRPTNRMDATGTARPASWKSWPVIVIGIAVLAIITAVIIMVWPPGNPTNADEKTLAPPPAPERMDTNPLPPSSPQGQADPWKGGGAAPDPAPAPSAPSVPDIDQIDPPDTLADPFRGGRGGPLDNAQNMMGAIMKHACDRLASCGTGGDDTIKQMCTLGQLAVPKSTPPSCAAAQRCLAAVDRLPCDQMDATTALSMMTDVQDCVAAMKC